MGSGRFLAWFAGFALPGPLAAHRAPPFAGALGFALALLGAGLVGR